MPRGKWFYIRSKLTGYVLDVEEGNTSPGTRVTVWDEHGGDNQQFFYHHYSDTIRCKLNGYCLDAVDDGNKIVLNPFGPSVSRWKIEGGCLREVETDKCLDISAGSTDTGADLILWEHHGGENQQWECDKGLDSPFFYIMSVLSPRVLDIEGGDSSEGTNVITYGKNDDQPDNQLWYEDGNGCIRSKLNDFCIDSRDGSLCMKPYDGDHHQKWDIEDEYIVNHYHNKVIDIEAGKAEDCAKLCAWERHGGENQKFYIINV